MPSNQEDNASTHSEASNSDYNRFQLSEAVKSSIYAQIADSEESLPWGDGSEERARSGSTASAAGMSKTTSDMTVPPGGPGGVKQRYSFFGGRTLTKVAETSKMGKNTMLAPADVPDTSDLLTPKPTKNDVDPLDAAGADLNKVPTAQDDEAALADKDGRPGPFRRLTTRIRRTISAQQTQPKS